MRPCALWLICAALICAAALLTGCQQPEVRMVSFQEQVELRDRAEDLLLRAARGPDPQLASNAVEALVQIQSRDALPVFRAGLRSDSPLLRFASCIAIGEVRDRTAREGVLRLMADSEPHVRLAAAFAAYRLGDSGAAATLANALVESPDENIRADAAYLIGRIGEAKAQRRLRAALETEANQKSNKVTVLIYGALAAVGDSHAVDQLIGYAQGETVSRVLALQSLAQLAPPRARDAFLYRMSPAEDYLENRLWAARGLGKLGLRDGYELALHSTRYVPQSPQVDDPLATSRVRALAALALGDIGDERALPRLRVLADQQEDAQVQVAACYAICRIIRR